MTAVRHHVREGCAFKAARTAVLILGVIALSPMLPGQVAAQGLGLRTYSASGMHQCGGGERPQSCVVTGGFYRDCNEAASALRAQDCCPTSSKGSRSTGFTLSYCIPESGLGR